MPLLLGGSVFINKIIAPLAVLWNDHGMTPAPEANTMGYVDVKFESLMDDVENALNITGDASDSAIAVSKCIRAAKLHFYKVLERYGSEYEHNHQRILQLTDRATSLAEVHAPAGVRQSLERHSREIHEALKELAF